VYVNCYESKKLYVSPVINTHKYCRKYTKETVEGVKAYHSKKSMKHKEKQQQKRGEKRVTK
jgi:hypothetical protein